VEYHWVSSLGAWSGRRRDGSCDRRDGSLGTRQIVKQNEMREIGEGRGKRIKRMGIKRRVGEGSRIVTFFKLRLVHGY
jgi:hypothetical protein